MDTATRTEAHLPLASLLSVPGAFYLGLVAWLITIVVVPLALGWRPYAVVTGSMAPRIPVGSVVVASPHDGRDLGVGTVVVFRDHTDQVVTHRIVEISRDGTYRTRGDANPAVDTDPLHPDQVLGVGRLLAPALGLPAVWARERAVLPLLIWTLGTAAAFAALAREDSMDDPPSTASDGDGLPDASVLKTCAVAGVCALALSLLAAMPYTLSAFTGSSAAPDSTWTAGEWVLAAGFVTVTADDLPADGTGLSQDLRFTVEDALAGGETVAITLDGAQDSVTKADYRNTSGSASDGGAVTVTAREQGPNREAAVTYTAPAGGVAAGGSVTITVTGIATGGGATNLPAVFTRGDNDETASARFSVVAGDEAADGFTSAGASDLPANATGATQTFTFAPDPDIAGGAVVTINLTEAHRGPVDYRGATVATSSAGTATLTTTHGGSAQRTARIEWTAPAEGLPVGETVTIELADVSTGGPAAQVGVTYTRDDHPGSAGATFDVQ